MLKNKIEKALYNPAIGLIPILLVVFLLIYQPINQAVDAALSIATIMFVIFVWLMGKRVFQLFLLVSLLTLLFYNAIIQLLPIQIDHGYGVDVLEFIFIALLSVMKMYERIILKYVDGNFKIGIKIHLKPALQMYFFVSKLFIYALLVHLFISILLQTSLTKDASYPIENWLHWFFPVLILLVGIIEFMNIKWIGLRINEERYLPIIDNNSRVIGHIALSESLAFEKKFLHPMVRVVFKYDKKLYLKERPTWLRTEIGMMCLPIEDYINYGENMEDAVKRVMHHYFGKNKFDTLFLLKYVHDYKGRRTLNYLYLVNLDSDKYLHPKDLRGGKLWTENQIVENLGKGYFSSAFESEFEYLQSTVLMADKYGTSLKLDSR